MVTSAPSRARPCAIECPVRASIMSAAATVTLSPSMWPNLRHRVYRSSSAWVGCSQWPQPPLMTGAELYDAPSRASTSFGWRNTMTLAYWETQRSMSASDSSFAIDDVVCGVFSTMTLPPMRYIAVSKLMRVRVEGWKKRSETMASGYNCQFPRFCSSRLRPSSKSASSWSFVIELIEMKLCPSKSTSRIRDLIDCIGSGAT